MKRNGLLMLVAVVVGAGIGWGQKRPVTFEDILNTRAVGSAVISPDGSKVLFTATGWEASERDADEEEEEGNKPPKMESRSHIWWARSADGMEPEPRQLTFGERGESAPAWSPDGSWISFVAARGRGDDDEEEPRSQIWLMRSRGGEATRLTNVKEGVMSYDWSEDSQQIAFTSRDALSEDDEGRRKQGDDENTYEDPTLRGVHLWTVDIGTKEAVQHTSGAEITLRGRPSWAPDGTAIAFAAAPTALLRDSRSDIYLLKLEDDSREAITTNLGPDSGPAWSPDGAVIAYLATPNENVPPADGMPIRTIGNSRLMLYDVSARTTRDASSPSFDLSPDSLNWTPDAKRLVFTVGETVYRELYAYELQSGTYERLTERKIVSMGSVSEDGNRIAFTMESAEAPTEVYVAEPGSVSPRRLTDVHSGIDQLALGRTEVITWKSTEGFEIEGILLKPVGYVEGERYPLLVVVHGGPTGAHVNYFRVRYGDGGQHWAGQGWAVLYPNPRGSTNYGERFMRANIPDWGGGDYRDIMSGVDALVERGIADPDKLAVQGWSYGGYMTCWVVSQTTRFKAAMIGAGLTNLVSMYGTNDVPNYLGSFFHGMVSPETKDLYEERSGLTYADQVKTPTLILHGARDERVPIGQPMEFFRALKDRGVTTELVFYPREGHGLREYYHRLDRLQRQYDWIVGYTLGEGAGSTEQGSPEESSMRP